MSIQLLHLTTGEPIVNARPAGVAGERCRYADEMVNCSLE